MLQVRTDLCLGCGLCAQICPRQAISLVSGQAEIDQDRCVPCRLCRQMCPQGAILDMVPVSKEEIQETLVDLKHRTDNLMARIERLRKS